MKLAFSDKFVGAASFVELCNVVKSYGFNGLEISDAAREREMQSDSIFRSSVTADAKRKLVNRHIEIPVIDYPNKINETTNSTDVIKYVEYAALASVGSVVIEIEKSLSEEQLKKVLSPVIVAAENNGVTILIETCGELSNTEKTLEVINVFGTVALKVCWNIRETFFNANETADKTIQTLGAYIGYVRLGDKKDGQDILVGEGELPVKDFINALRSLNYDGFVSVMDSGAITNADILLTHF